MTTDAYIALGSNLGDRQHNIDSAVDAIARLPGAEVTARSTVIETDPVGPAGQDRYLNGVIHIRTTLAPRALLGQLLRIESEHGRERSQEQRWGARTLDLDILVYAGTTIDEPGLTLPHPRLHERPFVLIPLSEIAPDLTIPAYEKTPRDLLGALEARS